MSGRWGANRVSREYVTVFAAEPPAADELTPLETISRIYEPQRKARER